MIPDITFLLIGSLRVESGWHLKMHSHRDFNELIIPIQGQEDVYTADGKEFIIHPGDAILFPRQCSHEEFNRQSTTLETIFISFAGDVGKEFIKVSDPTTKLRELAQYLLQLNLTEDADIEFLRQAYLTAIVGEFLFMARKTCTTDLFISKVRKFIYNNISDKISIESLAKHVNMSKFHFIRKYKSFTGITPMEEVRRIRLNEARNLITATELPLKVIAFTTGFSDEYIFSKNFKKVFGRPPGSYRQKIAKRQ